MFLFRNLLVSPSPAVTRLAIDPRAGRLFVAAHSRTRTSHPRVIFLKTNLVFKNPIPPNKMHLLHPAPIQGTIYIYTTAGKPVKEAKLIKTKVGVVTGLTLDPVKQVLGRIGVSWNLIFSPPRLCSGLTRQPWLCATAPTWVPTAGLLPPRSRCSRQVDIKP